jgi:hypothetical protein
MAGVRGGLQTVFAIFLGLMVAAFVGVGVYTFYPPPESRLQDRFIALDRQDQAIRNGAAPEALTPEDRARMQKIADERNQLEDEQRTAREAWGRVTSIILVVFATAVMAVSLLGAPQLPVISNGLLLGGLFTMIYGVGWTIVSDSSATRFVVISIALAITLGLGYSRFARRAGSPPPQAPVASTGVSVDLEARVSRLEQRLDEAASALGSKQP